VLVVDDAPALAEVVAEGLRDQGMAVDVALDGLTAAEKLDLAPYFPELVLRVRALARRRPAARPRTLRAAGLELDPNRRTATRDGRRLDLSVKEFALLEALLRAAPAFLSAESLLEQVWDENADPFTNTVTVTIGRLRRKLGEPQIITTKPGVGYRIAD
jgi:DNA-binding response OmpR family regulator